jgi:hypothetical protein
MYNITFQTFHRIFFIPMSFVNGACFSCNPIVNGQIDFAVIHLSSLQLYCWIFKFSGMWALTPFRLASIAKSTRYIILEDVIPRILSYSLSSENVIRIWTCTRTAKRCVSLVFNGDLTLYVPRFLTEQASLTLRPAGTVIFSICSVNSGSSFVSATHKNTSCWTDLWNRLFLE